MREWKKQNQQTQSISILGKGGDSRSSPPTFAHCTSLWPCCFPFRTSWSHFSRWTFPRCFCWKWYFRALPLIKSLPQCSQLWDLRVHILSQWRIRFRSCWRQSKKIISPLKKIQSLRVNQNKDNIVSSVLICALLDECFPRRLFLTDTNYDSMRIVI